MITALTLRNFRNYANLAVNFKTEKTLFIGANGQGKTNILEAVFFLSMLRSFRTASVKDLQKTGRKGWLISAAVNTGRSWDELFEAEYGETRTLRIDSVPVRKASEFIGRIHTVVFSPSDIMLVTENSALRRRFLNMLISSFSRPYLNNLNNYANALKMRNSLLKNQPADTASLQAFEQILAEAGTAIVAERQSVISNLSANMLELLTEIKGGSPVFSLKYNFHPAALDPALYLAKFADDRAKEAARGYTMFGPHLDDFDFILEDKDLRHYGSTGQCRLAALCLKMAAVNLIAEKTDSSSGVIALVDDATGELDEPTRAAFFKVLDNTEQSFFTFTEKPDDSFFSDAGTFRVENGCLTG